MKKWGFLLCIILIGYVITRSPASFQQKDEMIIEIQDKHENHTGDTVSITGNIQDQVHKGNLLLVNSTYPVHQEGIKTDIINVAQQDDLVRGYGLLDQNILLSREVAQAFQKMIEAAGEEGVRYFLISSGYRDFAKQNELYQEKGSDYALPAGHSEHNLGLSMDIGSTLATMDEAPEGAWLEKNAWKYGFILRYPKDKVSLTGIQYEPWHFRYVGLPHSAVMYKNNLVLEEYLDLLKEKDNIMVEVEGEKYHIRYYRADGDTTVYIPEHGRYDISGDNKDGVIVTVKE
ncbi:D-alanyl-D-alanine carboxypeptidase family protein [Paenibacillus sp. P13VS]|uniref:M15 family metallopeptidase n=1 Tax=Paenibacillus sp. P13VS TaxID=2697367 RepID=UPI00187B2E70|nr:M15 family metallopeptidase [Paenibacillus sp. P13VS]MBE7683862.1 D-Ala-D-Ala carboxypeptidase VanY [Paenibacillus sp. P13VS]